jgi:hypothetical protein
MSTAPNLAGTRRTIDPQHVIHHFSKRRGGGQKGYLHLPLSNFFPSPIPAPGGRTAPTVEHYFAAAKTLDKDAQSKILSANNPGGAKAMGRDVVLRPDWEEIKLAVMRRALNAKFARWGLGLWLVETAPYELIEGNYWGDTFWGMVPVEKGSDEWHGMNWLGILLMARRAELMSGNIEFQAPLFDELITRSERLVPDPHDTFDPGGDHHTISGGDRPACPNRLCTYGTGGQCSVAEEFQGAQDVDDFYETPEMARCVALDEDR